MADLKGSNRVQFIFLLRSKEAHLCGNEFSEGKETCVAHYKNNGGIEISYFAGNHEDQVNSAGFFLDGSIMKYGVNLGTFHDFVALFTGIPELHNLLLFEEVFDGKYVERMRICKSDNVARTVEPSRVKNVQRTLLPLERIIDSEQRGSPSFKLFILTNQLELDIAAIYARSEKAKPSMAQIILPHIRDKQALDKSVNKIVTDLRVNSIRQIPRIIQLCQEYGEFESNKLLIKLREAGKKIVAYLHVTSRNHKLHQQGIFDSDNAVFFIPLFPKVSISLQLESLSTSPDSFFFKVSEFMGTHFLEDSQQILKEISAFTKLNKHIFYPSRFETQLLLLDRFKFSQLLKTLTETFNENMNTNSKVYQAPFQLLDWPFEKESLSNVKYPVICKSRLAGGNSQAHDIGIALSYEGIQEFGLSVLSLGGDSGFSQYENSPQEKYEIPKGLILQEYIQHQSETVYKLLVAHNMIYINEQKSLPNIMTKTGLDELQKLSRFSSTQNLYIVNSGELKKAKNRCIYHGFLAGSPSSSAREKNSSNPQCIGGLCIDYLSRFINILVEKFRISLFGLDVVVETAETSLESIQSDKTGRVYIVDVNHLPSFEGLDVSELKREFHLSLMKSNF